MATILNNDVWVSVSATQKQRILHVGSFILGVGIIVFTYIKAQSTLMQTSEYAALAVGSLLVLLATWAFFMNIAQTIIVDKVAREIRVVTKSRVRTQTKNIAFAEIATFELSELGDPEGGNTIYYVTVTDTRGVKHPLFSPVYFEGRFSRATMEGNLERLKECLK